MAEKRKTVPHETALYGYVKGFYDSMSGAVGSVVSRVKRPFSPNDFANKYASADDIISKENKLMFNPEEHRLYPGSKAANPLKLISRARQLRVYADDLNDAMNDASPYLAADQLTKTNEEVLTNPVYSNALAGNTAEIQRELDEYHEQSKHAPSFVSEFGFWKLGSIYHSAKAKMREQHKDDAKNLATAMINKGNEATLTTIYGKAKNNPMFKMIIAGYQREIENLTEKNIDADNDEARELRNRMAAEVLLTPVHKQESADLDAQITKSQMNAFKQHDTNKKWIPIILQQDPELIEAAQKVHRERCEKNIKEEREKVKAALEEDKKKKEGNELFSLTSVVPPLETGEVLSDSFLIENDPESLPTFEDFKTALQKDDIKKKGIKFQLVTDDKKIVKLSFLENGAVYADFGQMTAAEVRRSPKVLKVCYDMATTLWCSYDQKSPVVSPENRKADLVATSEAQAEVLYRAALMRGFKVENLTMTIKKDITAKDDPGRPFVVPDEIRKLANKYNRFSKEDSVEAIKALLKDTPAFLQENDAYNKNEEAYKDTLAIFEEITAAASTNDNARFALAVDQLNTIQFGSKISNSSWHTPTSERFKTSRPSDKPIPVKAEYTPTEKEQIVAAVQQAQTKLEEKWNALLKERDVAHSLG